MVIMTNRSQKNFYTGAGLDRATVARKQADWLAQRLAAPESRFLAVWRGQFLVASPPQGVPDGAETAVRPAYLDPGSPWWREAATLAPAFLGVEGDIAHFAVDLSGLEEGHPDLLGLGTPTELRTLAHQVDRSTASLLAYVRGLLGWHQRHRFCGVCGTVTEVIEGGHVRRCTNPDCKTLHFPRTDPAVIMLVHDGDRCVMGRQARFGQGMYSTLAGFVEPGESLEEAVAREVMEEAGIQVTDVRYQSSQPWPFPSSLMLGFHARAVTTELKVDLEELEDARWFSRDEVYQASLRSGPPDGSLRIPPGDSIARRLIEDWLEGEV
ncbi:NADH pyrophosphatase [Nitrospirillum viridazoti CBAmc]|uniref:NAD(+) diphosphatase n=2 Tax=Nitrospirillum TaxID=1543705 RepID=A0A248JM29_9PROT|nr:NAD(+) diphosphatase [Nitrospirillum amazonense]ASG19699.1 NADH pyrophosphatase [Nitrospirillum amazonense CBAmc]